ncbi:MAG TPA: S8 family serine peptidase [Solirubrobacterales bacterium]|nr:S8 family serine peptidase [Solirubrobacterales bacterium]
MRRLLRILPPLALIAALTALAAPAHGEQGIGQARKFAPRQLLVKFEGERSGRALKLPAGAGVVQTAAALRRNPDVVYAEPNYVAHISANDPEPFDPDDSGMLETASPSSVGAGDWAFKQWNFLAPRGTEGSSLPISPGGIDAVGAWRNLIEVGRPGAAGVVVAVLDSGIAYRSLGSRFLRSPDFSRSQFVPGYDYVDRDRLPLDEGGHGTHVAGTIAEGTDNGIGVTGLAYNAKLMPLRVIGSDGEGYALDIARAIRFAVAHEAQVINMSFNFKCGERVPMVNEALRDAYKQGVVTVASAGNLGDDECISAPATGPRVIGVSATTEGACLGNYALAGRGIDLLAPGGGKPQSRCPSVAARPIYQVTLRADTTNEFAIPANYTGTSMAAAHVSGVAAMVLAGRVINPLLPPTKRVDAVRKQLRHTARDLGFPRTQQGAGLIDAKRATGTYPKFFPAGSGPR